jgi:hypothetical protein
MKIKKHALRFAKMAVFTALLATGLACKAQEPTGERPQSQSQEQAPVISRDVITQPQEQNRRQADGGRHGLPVETYAVAPSTKFLVRLEENLNTKGNKDNDRFVVRTLEPLEAGSGIYLPAGAEIHGHISHVEQAGVTGRAKLWLTFDDIRTKFGELPIVAEVTGVPGDHTVRLGGPKKEGLIEGRSDTQQDAAEAAAMAAALGAVKGVKDKDKKEAAEGAALAAITAYLMETGRGHELNLGKGTKLELELERALYLVKD